MCWTSEMQKEFNTRNDPSGLVRDLLVMAFCNVGLTEHLDRVKKLYCCTGGHHLNKNLGTFL